MPATTFPGTPSLLRVLNDRTALGLLLEHDVLTRNRLGELSGLSKPTASQMMQRLEAAGLIEQVGEISGGRGPNAVGYGVRADRVLGVAIDIQVDLIRASVVDVKDSEYPIHEQPFPAGSGENAAVTDVRAAIAGACAAAGVDTSAVKVVALGIQGSIDPATDELSFVDTLAGWPTVGVRLQLEQDLGLTVLIDNDVKLAAVAERSNGIDGSSFALLWMGDGLGLAVDLDGAVYRGAAGGAGEIGYLRVPREAAGIDEYAQDLQDLIGGPKVAHLARQYGVPGDNDHEVITAIASHPNRSAVLEKLAPRIALGILPVLAILDPEVVVLGGPTGTAGGAELADLVRSNVQRTSHWNPRVITTAVEKHPVLRGARDVLLAEVREQLFAELGALP